MTIYHELMIGVDCYIAVQLSCEVSEGKALTCAGTVPDSSVLGQLGTVSSAVILTAEWTVNRNRALKPVRLYRRTAHALMPDYADP